MIIDAIMNTIFFVLPLMLLFLIFSNVHASPTYVDKLHGFQIDYPSEWSNLSSNPDSLFQVRVSDSVRNENDGLIILRSS